MNESRRSQTRAGAPLRAASGSAVPQLGSAADLDADSVWDGGDEACEWVRGSPRFLGGLAFSALFLLRGFGITAWTHALYDVLIVASRGL